MKQRVQNLRALLFGMAGLLLFNTALASQTNPANVWIVKEGKHTSLILRTEDTQQRLPLIEAQNTSGPLVMISWGDAAYYQTRDKTIKLALRALFLPTPAALNARNLASLQDAPQTSERAKLYAFALEADDLSALLERIALALDENGQIRSDGLLAGVANDYVGGRFYPAHDRRYSALFTCNNWVADVLKAGDLKFSRGSSQFAGVVVLQHKVQWLISSRYREQTRFRSQRISTQKRGQTPGSERLHYSEQQP